ncbi:site-2 protease family protein [Paenibacillus hamazuiensis]|uniref:site-2 protease family protein n=1 Tax=Paenibacillus hamazuiensis TaxID=2936508 RepID=UPI00200DD2A5|nr:site-2 protease family protein [Paenibacillus hamazuiensis]
MDWNFFRYPLDEIPFVLLVLLIAFTLHEFAHAYTAYKFGDPTAKNLGRVTLNPRVHLDIIGTLLILIAGFGWAKPVPVNRGKFKHPRLMGIVVSVAGPLANLLIAFVGMLICYILFKFHLVEAMSTGVYEAVRLFMKLLIFLNLTLFLFNLLPLPPLDGYRIVEDILPLHLRLKFAKIEQWAIYIFLLMVFIPPISRVTLGPVFALQMPIFAGIDALLSGIFGYRVDWVKFLLA